MFPVLETQRLFLREITMQDAIPIYSYLSLDEVTRYYGRESMESLEQAEEIVALFDTNYRDKRGIRWGIERKDTGQFIGTVGFHSWVPRHRRAEIGYEIHPDHWRKGYASEAIREAIAFGHDTMNLSRIGAITFIDNEASGQLLLKLGFEKEGVLRDYMVHQGASHHAFIYSLIHRG
ncbi:GNAT family N-acetyltransferase [Paenibacillus sp. Marseille-Q4541]|uniref:GNAT family N-acetyltransferase n=1 Tax=Paenibacillus sp. Marseille-Q4541 TaxID=2831522 RepID=UPI001BAA96B4|nr:GNAT family N-acetyltransferase [Paenibacillus sp. Marseille-Q4541]